MDTLRPIGRGVDGIVPVRVDDGTDTLFLHLNFYQTDAEN